MAVSGEIRDLIEKTPFVDTHEHLLDERTRLRRAAAGEIPTDIGYLFSHYADSDLIVAGMSADDWKRVTTVGLDAKDKWKLIAPCYARTRHTGYLQNVRESVRMLYGEDDIRDDNFQAISDKVAANMKPGFYHRVLNDLAKVEYTQVNSFEHVVFNRTEDPALLCQDLSFVALSTQVSPEGITTLSKESNIEVGSLDDWIRVVDWCFAAYGPRAIAVKNQSAYNRRLNYAQVSKDDAARAFARFLAKPDGFAYEDCAPFSDFLFHYCVEKAVEYNLPVKLHTGYYAGSGRMPLHRVAANPGDMCELLQAHPAAKFVMMHITYPYQDEAIAIAKHYPNAYVDMCWAWIINPAASVRLVKEYLMAAPANKLFTFGGDYTPVELVPGHARIARKGLAQALSELVDEDWLDARDVPALVERLMRGNAHEVYDYKETLKAWG
ncbi:MAG: amidohydrolase family protein [Candidatus Hydrogenedentes bacterium]|nr:amidohydrolase family protein [Candidatus Hydrogenedentota bacterium]